MKIVHLICARWECEIIICHRTCEIIIVHLIFARWECEMICVSVYIGLCLCVHICILIAGFFFIICICEIGLFFFPTTSLISIVDADSSVAVPGETAEL